MAGNIRLQLQLEHIRDLIKEQNRMLITEIEPTSSERDDVLSLLASIRKAIVNGPRNAALEVESSYRAILSDLAELGYNISPFEFELPPDPAAEINKRAKHVRFEQDQLHPLIDNPDTPRAFDSADSHAMPSNADGNSSYSDGLPGSENSSSELSSAQLYQQNNYIYEDQDRRLEEISRNVNRQRQLGEGITGELDFHNNLLDDLESQTERSQSRIDVLTGGVRKFNRKSKDCGVCSIIMVLVLILFILLLL